MGLKRGLNTFDAVLLGLGSILGTGVFVSLGLASGEVGYWMLVALAIAAALAAVNGLSSAQLAAVHPVSGGTYEYGYRFLAPGWGFTAGWLFLVAKSASCATAALGFVGYLAAFGDFGVAPWQLSITLIWILALSAVAGIHFSKWMNLLLVAVTVFCLCSYVIGILFFTPQASFLWPSFSMQDFSIESFFAAISLLFVAFTGYGRIATLSEEVLDPRSSIPKAIVFTLIVSMVLYFLVAFTSLVSVGPMEYYQLTTVEVSPLQKIAEQASLPTLSMLLSVGALTAMAGVAFNLVLGLSRVVYAMGKRLDAPQAVIQVNRYGSPYLAIISVALLISCFILLQDIAMIWSLSAFTVLLYYAVTNISALMVGPEDRFIPKWVSVSGLLGCLLFAPFLPLEIGLQGIFVIACGWVLRYSLQWRRKLWSD